jgi:hypothetical protein
MRFVLGKINFFEGCFSSSSSSSGFPTSNGMLFVAEQSIAWIQIKSYVHRMSSRIVKGQDFSLSFSKHTERSMFLSKFDFIVEQQKGLNLHAKKALYFKMQDFVANHLILHIKGTKNVLKCL